MEKWTGRIYEAPFVKNFCCVNLNENPIADGVDCRSIYQRLINFGYVGDNDLPVFATWDLDKKRGDSFYASKNWISADRRKRKLRILSISYCYREQFGDYIAWPTDRCRGVREIDVDSLLGLPPSEISYLWNVYALDQLGLSILYDPIKEGEHEILETA